MAESKRKEISWYNNNLTHKATNTKYARKTFERTYGTNEQETRASMHLDHGIAISQIYRSKIEHTLNITKN